MDLRDGRIDKISYHGWCHARGRSRLLYLEHLVIASINYQCIIQSQCYFFFLHYLDLSNLILEFGFSYFIILTICPRWSIFECIALIQSVSQGPVCPIFVICAKSRTVTSRTIKISPKSAAEFTQFL